MAVLGYIEAVNMENESYQVNSTTCLNKGYKYNTLSIYATSIDYLNGIEIKTLVLPDIKEALKSNIDFEPWGGQVPDTDPTNRIEEYYRIVGFTNSIIYFYKWKQVTGYNNGQLDLVQTFVNPIKMDEIKQSIPTLGDDIQASAGLSIFPIPASNDITVAIDNNYSGEGIITLINIDGVVVKSVKFNKQSKVFETKINIEYCSKGSYIIKIAYGDNIITKKSRLNSG